MGINKNNSNNPLGTVPLNKLLVKFAVPSIVAMIVTGLYNIVDQIFIGNYVGTLGNGATNIAFPLSTLCTATSLLFGIGGAAAFNLSMGKGEKDRAGKYAGNAFSISIAVGIILMILSEIFLNPMLVFFGASEGILPYATVYTKITAVGFPFLIASVTGGHLIRADGKPMIAMICNLAGAIVNTALDAIFVAVLGWGMEGAAIATVIGQIVAAAIATYNVISYKTVELKMTDYIPNASVSGMICKLGMSQGFNQVAMMVVQIVSNNSLKHYGELSQYGSDIPIAVVGISTKMAMLYFSFCIGLSHALQPIASFNYGAQNYKRTKDAFTKTRNAGTVISVVAFLIFQIFPRQLFRMFGDGSELYFEFAVKYMRIFMFCTFVNNIQPMTSTFLSAIGKPVQGLFLSLTRQIIFLLPLLIILPLSMGINGMLYAGLIADALAFIVALIFSIREFSRPEYKKQQPTKH